MLFLLLVGRRKKRKDKRQEKKAAKVFFTPGPEARHALLAVLKRIFMAVRCN
jgi:hypothetical protein